MCWYLNSPLGCLKTGGSPKVPEKIISPKITMSTNHFKPLWDLLSDFLLVENWKL